MRLTKKKSILGVLVATSLISACAPPQVEKREFSKVETSFGPLQSDTRVNVNADAVSDDQRRQALSLNGTMASAEYLQMTESLIQLGQLDKNKNISDLGLKLIRDFYASPVTTKTSFANSVFVAAAIGETGADEQLRSSVSKMDKNPDNFIDVNKYVEDFIVEQTTKLLNALDESNKNFAWPKQYQLSQQVIVRIEMFLNLFSATVQKDTTINDEVKRAVKASIDQNLKQMAEAEKRLTVLEAETQFSKKVAEVKDIISFLKQTVDDDSLQQLAKAEALGKQIDAVKSSQDALTLIIDLWKQMTPEDRVNNIKAVNEDLYKLLDESDEAHLKYLHDIIGFPESLNFFKYGSSPVKKPFILDALSKYGVGKIRKSVNEALCDYLIKIVRPHVAASTTDIPNIVKTSIIQEISSNRAQIEKGVRDRAKVEIAAQINAIKNNPKKFISDMTQTWAENTILNNSKEINAIETDSLKISSNKSDDIKIDSSKAKIDQSTSEVIGSSLIAQSYILNQLNVDDATEKRLYMKTMIEQINKLLIMGGFRKTKDQVYPSYAMALDAPVPQDTFLNLRNFLSSPYSFAVPDVIKLKDAYNIDRQATDSVVSVRSQAELLRGVSQMIRDLKDWKVNSFDKALGTVKLAEVAEKYKKSLPKEQLEQNLFPKDTLFALAVGNAAVILQNIMKDLTPVFLINIQSRLIWADQFDFNEGTPATLAGMVDIFGRTRGNIVKSEDISRYILAIVDFMDAIEGIDQTKSAPLVEKSKDGICATEPTNEECDNGVQTLIKSKDKLRLLVIGLANFLSHQMQASDGGFQTQYDIDKNEVVAAVRTLNDQALGIQALDAASKLIGLDIYKWSALDAYYFMNHKLWNSSFQFYTKTENAEEAPGLADIIKTMKAVETIKPHLSAQSSAQWDKIASPWVKSMETF